MLNLICGLEKCLLRAMSIYGWLGATAARSPLMGAPCYTWKERNEYLDL